MTSPLFIISGPSGSGKSTLVASLLQQCRKPLRQSISATTRPPREGEIDGQQYHFWSRERFEREMAAGAFLEFAHVHGTDWYGTPNTEVEPFLLQGIGVILVIDVQGAQQVRKKYADAYSIFIRVPGDDYRARLSVRGDSESNIERRLMSAQSELLHASSYSVQVLNDQFEQTVEHLRQLVECQFSIRKGENHHVG